MIDSVTKTVFAILDKPQCSDYIVSTWNVICPKTLKTRDWKTHDQISRVENARPPSIEREMDKYKIEKNIIWYVYFIINII